MSNTLQLNCRVLCNDPQRVFSIKIESSETISYLKKAIKDEKVHMFNDLDLWKVSNPGLHIRHFHRDDLIF